MRRSKNIFKFNLLPPKSQEELAVESERDDSILYSVLLVFFAILVYGAVLAGQLFFSKPNVDAATAALQTKQVQVAGYNTLRASYGELALKAAAVESLLERDLNPEDIFRVGTLVRDQGTQVAVVGYSREADGDFVFDLITSDVEKLPDLLNAVKALEIVSKAELRSIDKSRDSGTARVIISVTITSLSTVDG